MKPAPKRTAWNIAEEDRTRVSALASALDIPRIVAHLLIERGIDTAEAAEAFLAPSASSLSDPFLLTDMQAAVDRITLAREREEYVIVFGDYDVDGITGTVVLMNALRRFGVARHGFGMPSRVTEGYGITPEHVSWARAQGASLIITVDNGINAREAANAARDQGVDLVITDHHQLEGELPSALAIVNPRREPAGHPAADISGVAVASKLAHALTGYMEDLDLVALGVVADIVPLQGENRAYVAMGLREMTRQPRLGLVKLADIAGIDPAQITAENIAFILGPRINAAGRLGDGTAPLQLFLTESVREAERIARGLNAANEERRAIEREMFDSAVARIEATLDPDLHAIVLADSQWHSGVIGIVAARLVGRYNRPVILISFDDHDETGRGSARSVPGFHLVDALGECKEYLDRFGGHSAAAGMTLRRGQLDAFAAAFEKRAALAIPDGGVTPTLAIDALVGLSEIDPQLIQTMARLEPFGHKNPAPVFCTCGVEIVPESFRELRGGHLKFDVRQGPVTLAVIAFRMAGQLSLAALPRQVDIAYTPKLNTWRGETSIQLVLKDLRPS